MDKDQLKIARKKLVLSQKNLGLKVGYTRYEQISKMERGISKIPKYIELAVKYLLLKKETSLLTISRELDHPHSFMAEYKGDKARYIAPFLTAEEAINEALTIWNIPSMGYITIVIKESTIT